MFCFCRVRTAGVRISCVVHVCCRTHWSLAVQELYDLLGMRAIVQPLAHLAPEEAEAAAAKACYVVQQVGRAQYTDVTVEHHGVRERGRAYSAELRTRLGVSSWRRPPAHNALSAVYSSTHCSSHTRHPHILGTSPVVSARMFAAYQATGGMCVTPHVHNSIKTMVRPTTARGSMRLGRPTQVAPHPDVDVDVGVGVGAQH